MQCSFSTTWAHLIGRDRTVGWHHMLHLPNTCNSLHWCRYCHHEASKTSQIFICILVVEWAALLAREYFMLEGPIYYINYIDYWVFTGCNGTFICPWDASLTSNFTDDQNSLVKLSYIPLGLHTQCAAITNCLGSYVGIWWKSATPCTPTSGITHVTNPFALSRMQHKVCLCCDYAFSHDMPYKMYANQYVTY
jgi:hypothetical protein